MNKLIIAAVLLVSLSCVAFSKEIAVQIKYGYNANKGSDYKTFHVEDDITVRELTNIAARALGGLLEGSRLENHLMITHNPDKTLHSAGIKDGTKLILKYWSRGEDLAANTLTRLIPLV